MFPFPSEDLQEPFKGRNKTFQVRTEQRASLFKKPHCLYIAGTGAVCKQMLASTATGACRANGTHHLPASAQAALSQLSGGKWGMS